MNEPTRNSRPASSDRTTRGVVRLVLAAGVTAFLWLVVLPRVADTSHVGDYLNWLEEKQIDPSAMFYTELEAMEPILDSLNEKRSQAAKR